MTNDESFLNESNDEDIIEILALSRERKKQNTHGESSRKSRRYIDWDTLEGHNRLFKDYFATLLKITTALRILSYGVTADFMDEYIRIGETTAIKSLRYFVQSVIDIFGLVYLRKPNSEDITRLLKIGEVRGFPGMLGSIDCMHWRWKNCPTAWKGSDNDINVLERSNVFCEITSGESYHVNYYINGHNYNMGYYLADGIYPPWAIFVKLIPLPMNQKTKHFTVAQESARKDVERKFGVLQARFAIVRGPTRYFDRETLNKIMLACIIMHNMIVEDERELHPQPDIFEYEQVSESPPIPIVSRTQTPKLMNFIQSLLKIRDRVMHSQIQKDLVEHLWNAYSMS
ncbi:uncharacterized protein LOC124921907 [Impatiens glandulifera]|uniref:uncharacterized protein LOC124921907 n=1 Tax=Impatiens glandulifera TaxID=253017 RepID=UPI001FB09CE8|nr:uncharacterized protein LOC124921907 [Impatiens glandulifera]